MHEKTILACLAGSALLVSATAMAGGSKWEKDGSKGGVTVYTRVVEGSEVKEVKAVGTIDKPTTDVFDFLIDSKKFLSVMPDVIKSDKIGECGENCGFWFQKLEHPPITDRFYVLKVQWKFTENEDGTTTIKRWWKATTEKAAPDKSGLRVEKLTGSWHFKPIENGTKTRFTYQNHVEMGGKIPLMLVNSAAVSNAYKFLQNLKKKLK